MFQVFGSNLNFNVEIGQLFYPNVLLIYNMETCGMIWNESNQGRLFKTFIKHYDAFFSTLQRF